MTPATACRLAGPTARVVCRPRGVAHVYTGPLTPSGIVPRGRRTVCRTHTGQLRVVGTDAAVGGKRLCLRCSACLTPQGRQAERPRTRDEWRAAYAGVRLGQFAYEAATALDVDILDQAAHLSLLLFGHEACSARIPHPTHPEWQPVTVHDLIGARRKQLISPDGTRLDRKIAADIEAGTERAKADRRDAWQDREDRIARLGFNIVKPR